MKEDMLPEDLATIAARENLYAILQVLLLPLSGVKLLILVALHLVCSDC
jgi:hypothetical protein